MLESGSAPAPATTAPEAVLPITRGSLADAAGDPLGVIRRQYETHGEISAFEDAGQRVIFVFGPEYNQRVLSDPETFHSYFFPLRGPKGSAQRRLTSGLLSQNGAHHREQRRMVMGPFQRRAFPAYVSRIVELTQAMLGGWRAGETRDMHVEMNRLMLRITSSILFGFNQPQLVFELGEMIERWGAMNNGLGLAALAPQAGRTGDYEALLSYAERLESKIREMIALRRGDPSGEDVLSILLKNQSRGDGLSDEELIGQTALLFSAAHLTSAHSMTWALFLLAQHPQEGERFSREVASGVPEREMQLDGLEPFSFTDRVIKETLRILPGSAYVQRVNVKPVQLGPFSLSRGTVVVFSQFMTHHMRELYEEPEQFQPDRWLTLRPSPYAYLPFGAGPRHCLGGPLALVIMKLIVPMVWQRFRMRVEPGACINANAVSTMLTPMTPVPMQLLSSEAALERTPIRGNILNYVDLTAP
jgi:cytochrome P450